MIIKHINFKDMNNLIKIMRNALYSLVAICIFLLIIWFDYSIIIANIDGFKHGFDDDFLTVFVPIVSIIILAFQLLAVIKKYCC